MIVTDSEGWHVGKMAQSLRDLHNLDARGYEPRKLLWGSYRNSFIRRTALVDGNPVAMWGCAGTLLSGHGTPWLCASSEAERYRFTLLKQAKIELQGMLGVFGTLAATVNPINAIGARFLRHLGFRETGFAGDGFSVVELSKDFGAPFIVYALPRSRTAWLAKFLTYRKWACHHEYAIKMREIADISTFFKPMMGSCETAAAPGWAILKRHVPNLKQVVVLRPVEDVVESIMNLSIDGFAYDRDVLRKGMEYGDRVLRKIAAQPDVLTVEFADLNKENACRKIFEHCLPYAFDRDWWIEHKDQNIQADVASVLRYYFENKDGIERFKALCKAELRSIARR